jgi:hypothetical protein
MESIKSFVATMGATIGSVLIVSLIVGLFFFIGLVIPVLGMILMILAGLAIVGAFLRELILGK